LQQNPTKQGFLQVACGQPSEPGLPSPYASPTSGAGLYLLRLVLRCFGAALCCGDTLLRHRQAPLQLLFRLCRRRRRLGTRRVHRLQRRRLRLQHPCVNASAQGPKDKVLPAHMYQHGAGAGAVMVQGAGAGLGLSLSLSLSLAHYGKAPTCTSCWRSSMLCCSLFSASSNAWSNCTRPPGAKVRLS
jgi:hypothetical protein